MNAQAMRESSTATSWPMRLGAGLIVCAILIRVLSAPSLTPWWDLDPLTGWRPESTLTPALGLMLDAAAWVGAILIIAPVRRMGGLIRWKSGLLALLGVVGVVLHAAVLRPLTAGESAGPRGDFASLCLGSAWAAGVVGAWALLHTAADRTLRVAAALTLLSVVAVLGAKGGYQAFVEHPRVVASFDADPAAMLASKGWEPNSTSARLFERRLRQVEATGWFGLANVYGSVVGACAAAWIVLFIGALRVRAARIIASGEVGLIALVALAACGALALSGSKGAAGAAVVGLMCMLALVVIPLPSGKARIAASLMGPAIIGAVLALVLVRGAVGERSAELSLLFRSQYMEGATRIIADHPLTGVGPAGFKDAYLLARSPLSPEEIESPHSLPFDLIARLGLFGAAWFLLWAGWLCAAGRAIVVPIAARVSGGAGRWVSTTLAGAIVASIALERAVIGLDFVLLCLVSAAAAGFVVMVALRVAASDTSARFDHWMDRALVAAAFALAAHAMIDVTPVTLGSCAWFFGVCALAASRSRSQAATPDLPESSRGAATYAACLILALGACAVGFRAFSVWRWERALYQAAEALRPVGEFHDALADASTNPNRAAATIASLAAEASMSAPRSQADYEGLLQRLHALAIPRALTHLDQAAAIVPTAWDPRNAAARLEITLAFDLAGAGDSAGSSRRADGALARAAAIVDARPQSANAWGRLGALRSARAQIPALKAGSAEEMAAAGEAWKTAAGLDPHSLGPALALWRLARETSDHAAAERWGSRAMEIDAQLRLDPLKGLTDAERAELVRSFKEAVPPSPGPAERPQE